MTEEQYERAELRAYRSDVRSWLISNVERVGPGSGDSRREDPSPERLAEARRIQRKLYDAGYAGIAFPEEYGGQGLSIDHERVFTEESVEFEVPIWFYGVSVHILGATLAAFGTDEQKRKHLPRILSGEERWLQLLSEPSGGSDLAGLLTSAVRHDDVFVVNGQKTWSTGAHLSDYALCPVRTRWDVPKHRGISVLILDLRSPGIEVRRIKQIDGGAEFCEEFLTDVVVPASNLIGEEHQGWRVVRGLLEIEHAWVGRGGARRRSARHGINDLVNLVHTKGLTGDSGVNRKVVDLHVRSEAQTLLAARVSHGIETGKMTDGYGSMLKLGEALLVQRRAEAALELAGGDGVGWRPARGGDRWVDEYLSSRRMSIAGGTNEIQHNNLSERVLGLPREPAPDRDVPFSDVPHN